MTTHLVRESTASARARILCLGDEAEPLLRIQVQLDIDFDYVIVASAEEGHAALAVENAFDVIICDQQMRGARGALFLTRLRAHSPDAERIILAQPSDLALRALAATDGRVIRLLCRPCPASVLREVVMDALLRHRARYLRAAWTPRITPMQASSR